MEAKEKVKLVKELLSPEIKDELNDSALEKEIGSFEEEFGSLEEEENRKALADMLEDGFFEEGNPFFE